ncbi:MAG: hypothetical protein ACLP01_20490 [Solirubrobacteraceae bacterium]
MTANGSHAKDEYRPACEISEMPRAPAPVTRAIEQPGRRAKQSTEHPLPHRPVARAASAAQDGLRGYVSFDPIRPGRQHLNHGEPVKSGKRIHDSAISRRRD